LGRVVFAGSAVRVGKVPALVAQRVYASLLIDVQPARVEHRERVLGGHVRVGLVQRPVARLVYRPERREVYVQVRDHRLVEHRAVDAVQRPQRDVAVLRDAVAAGHKYASGRVAVGPDLDGRRELFAVRRVTVGPVIRPHPLTGARVHRVAQFQEHVHGGRRDLVAVPVAGERPSYRVATARARVCRTKMKNKGFPKGGELLENPVKFFWFPLTSRCRSESTRLASDCLDRCRSSFR